MDRRERARKKGLKIVQFLDMGSSGFFVWTAYGVAALAIAIEVVSVRLRLREAARADRDGDEA